MLIESLRAYNDHAAVECCGYACDGETLVLLDIVGHKIACKSLWASTVNHPRKPFRIAGNGKTTVQVNGGDVKRDKYTAFWIDLPEQNAHNALICHRRVLDATPQRDEAQPFYIVSAVAGDNPEVSHLVARFGMLLNQALDLPILPAWAEVLWDLGISAGLITELTHGGDICHAYRVETDGDPWKQVVQEALAHQQIAMGF